MEGIPYIPNTDAERKQMLKAIGVSKVDDLFHDIPTGLRHSKFDLPTPLSEFELTRQLQELADLNANATEYACFLGAGYYRHYIPGVISHITGRSELYTAYTSYQPEISQGTLQSLYDYQSLVCELTGMEVSNAGMYDGSSAAAEAALMASRITERSVIAVMSTVNPRYQKVISSYAGGHNIRITMVKPDAKALPEGCACIVLQYPDFFGSIEDIRAIVGKAHQLEALAVVIVNPVALGMYAPPGEFGADIVVGEAQPLGNPMSFGGPGLGIFTCKKEYVRQMPGRLVGKTKDVDGKTGYVLTLSTREQHIRRENATSNICTSEALVALASTVYLAVMGKSGLRKVAELSYHKAHYAASEIGRISGYSLVHNTPFFNEFVIRCPESPVKINQVLLNNKIIGGLDISETIDNGMLFCVTETNTKSEIDKLVAILSSINKG